MKKSKAKVSAKKVVKKVSKGKPTKSTTEPTIVEPKVEQKNDFRIKPLADRVVVRPDTLDAAEEKNTFGIIIPETVNKERPEQGEVIAVGEGRYENGKIIPVKVKVGDHVVFSKYGFDEIKDGEKELYIIKEENILAIIKK